MEGTRVYVHSHTTHGTHRTSGEEKKLFFSSAFSVFLPTSSKTSAREKNRERKRTRGGSKRRRARRSKKRALISLSLSLHLCVPVCRVSQRIDTLHASEALVYVHPRTRDLLRHSRKSAAEAIVIIIIQRAPFPHGCANAGFTCKACTTCIHTYVQIFICGHIGREVR